MPGHERWAIVEKATGKVVSVRNMEHGTSRTMHAD